MTTNSEGERIPGEILEEIYNDINHHEKLLDRLCSNRDKTHGSAKKTLDKYLVATNRKIEELQDLLRIHLHEHPVPPLVCPHCKYDGEFDVDKPKEGGFRILIPVLQPRIIMGCSDGQLEMSDPDESYDPFDCIANPEYQSFLDDDKDSAYASLRNTLRGKWLILCGKCESYFDAENIVRNAQLIFVCESPHESKWRLAVRDGVQKNFERTKMQGPVQ